ncbi:hypothetical protein CS063_09155 [Sporanaerobium hydrogeniformans]|uniref:Uncharacterized protein n=1 Tax=Sporanaerobium hydrogeniformans TaxID=3072179 RepID=A0AC61DBQ3_9FIRM|nr:AAA family ATPase [Sporanaerobium hydrogeniformans]PHV70689.1 hypothetical protein CS063_09155 [Sporanaerobium hydrogeniformans]
MGFAPLVNWRNFTVDNLKAMLSVYPDLVSQITSKEAQDLTQINLNSYKKTAYQFACQLGLEDRSKNEFKVQDYLYTFEDDYLRKYLEFWFKIYYAPNPFVRSEDKSILLYRRIAEKILVSDDKQIDYTEFFDNEIGGPRSDILLNCIEVHGAPLKVKNKNQKTYIYVDQEDVLVLQKEIIKIDKFPMPSNTHDRHEFFTRYSYENFCEFWDISKTLNISLLTTNNVIKHPHNRIIFGAPGTGKSYNIDKQRVAFGENYQRVTFHPNYSFAQFVGTYKPVPTKDSSESEIITYKYVPGPFMRIYANSVKSMYCSNPQPYLLIIEEINRANIAGVFGDVFQLLDRKCGVSEYEIESSEDIKRYLASAIFEKDYESCTLEERTACDKMRIPSNMYIWATMNSADQGVFPMDTAFKRRWNFEYIGVDDEEADMAEIVVTLGREEYETTIRWNDLRHAINNQLAKKVNEDKLLGPYFISKEVMQDSSKLLEAIRNKVLMYLFEDAARQCRGDIFRVDENNIRRYSSICNTFDLLGLACFHDDIIKEVSNRTPITEVKLEVAPTDEEDKKA